MSFKKLFRQIHYWGALLCAIPLIIVTVTGVLLLLKKDIAWIQPPTVKAEIGKPHISFDEILASINTVPEAATAQWSDIDRLDVRPGKGVIKARLKNNWEVQINPKDGMVMRVAFRRSDVIESIHDGTFFHNKAKLSVFLPAAIILLTLWMTGIYLFIITEKGKYNSRKKQRARKKALSK